MGTKRVGLARIEALMENLKRDLDMNSATFTDVAIKRKVVDLDGSTKAITARESGTTFTFDGTACTATLPTCEVGLEYWFLVDTTAAADAVIATQSADKLYGSLVRTVDGLSATFSSSGTQVDTTTGTNDNTLTMNGTTKGGIIGSAIHVIGMKDNAWYVTGTVIGSGTQVTAFS